MVKEAGTNVYKIVRGGNHGVGDNYTFLTPTTIKHAHGPTASLQPNGDLHWDIEGGKWLSRREGAPPAPPGPESAAPLTVSGLGAGVFASTAFSGVSFDGTYTPMGLHEGRPYYGCGTHRLYVSKMGHWCITNDPSQMQTNKLAQESPATLGLRFHPGTNIGLVSSAGATGKGLLGCPQFQPPQVRRWHIWNGQAWVHAPHAHFADAGAAMPVPSVAPAPPIEQAVGMLMPPPVMQPVMAVPMEAMPMGQPTGAEPSLAEIADTLCNELGVKGTTVSEKIDAACMQLGVSTESPVMEKARACWAQLKG